jgi:hypothetical protein
MLAFQTEVRAFEAALPKLLERYEGQCAVIRDGEVQADVFPTFEEALGWGYERFGLERFYVKQINDKARTTHFMRGYAE